jgi:hypothetical protein
MLRTDYIATAHMANIVSDRFCRPMPSEPTVEELVAAELKSSSLRNTPKLHTDVRILDGMDFPDERVPDETCCTMVAGTKHGSILALVIDRTIPSRDLYIIDRVPRLLKRSLPEVTAIAMYDESLLAFASGVNSVQIYVSGRGQIIIPCSSGLRVVEMHFINSLSLVAVLVGESSQLTLPVRSLVTIQLKGETPTVLITHVDMISRRSSIAWGCGMLALGGMDGVVYLFDVCGKPHNCRRVTGPGTGPISAVSFDQQSSVVYTAQGAELYYTRLDSLQGRLTKRVFVANDMIRFLHGTREAVVVLVNPSAAGPAISAAPLLVPMSGAVRTLHMDTRGSQSHVIGITGHGDSVAITQIDELGQIFQLVLFNVPFKKRKQAELLTLR